MPVSTHVSVIETVLARNRDFHRHHKSKRVNRNSQRASEERRPLRRQPEDHNFGSLIMLSVTAGAFLLATWVAAKALFLLLQEARIP
jgi:hypothetical protein